MRVAVSINFAVFVRWGCLSSLFHLPSKQCFYFRHFCFVAKEAYLSSIERCRKNGGTFSQIYGYINKIRSPNL